MKDNTVLDGDALYGRKQAHILFKEEDGNHIHYVC